MFFSVLNGCTRRGPFLGNSLGVVGKCRHFNFKIIWISETCSMKLTRGGNSLLGTCDTLHILIQPLLSAIHFIRYSIDPSFMPGNFSEGTKYILDHPQK